MATTREKVEKVIEAWMEQLKTRFPRGAKLDFCIKSDNGYIDVSWGLEDSTRANKRSRTIRLLLARETIDDYLVKGDAQRLRSDKKLKKFVKKKIQGFNPDPDQNLPPMETWTISTFDIN